MKNRPDGKVPVARAGGKSASAEEQPNAEAKAVQQAGLQLLLERAQEVTAARRADTQHNIACAARLYSGGPCLALFILAPAIAFVKPRVLTLPWPAGKPKITSGQGYVDHVPQRRAHP
jgi:hypothetical protein